MNRAWLSPTLGLALVACDAVHWGEPVTCDAPAAPVSAPAPTGALGVLSWNLHGTPDVAPMDARIARIADAIRVRAPHFVLLQEVWFEGDATRIETALANAYQRVADDPAVGDTLAGALSGHRSGGLLAFVRADAEISADASQFTRFHDHAPRLRVQEGDGFSGKGFQRIDARIAGRALRLFNTHLQAQYAERHYDEVRTAQLTQLVAAATERVAGGAVLVAGDLNTTPAESSRYDLLSAAFSDLTEVLRAAQGTTNGSEWLDYVFARGSGAEPAPHVAAAELIPSERDDCPYSDHYGVLVWLES